MFSKPFLDPFSHFQLVVFTDKQACNVINKEVFIGSFLVESHVFCAQNIKELCLGTDSVLCCWVRREDTVGGGGNYHIKGKEFKINLISQSPPPSE